MMESFLNGKIALHIGDCLDVLPTLPDNSIDSSVTDPPYHLTSIVRRFGAENAVPPISQVQRRFNKTGAAMSLGPDGQPTKDQYGRLSTGFMGKQWDGGDIAFTPELWRHVYRVLKPGAHLVAFGGTRTYHRMACAIEDAGFEIRDCIQWLYGSGFPKSHDVSKGIDRAAGAEREVIGQRDRYRDGVQRQNKGHTGGEFLGLANGIDDVTAPATDAARQWEGWGTSLKPANEPIVLARKPLSEKTVAANVLKWGTGAINVDGCRVEAPEGIPQFSRRAEPSANCYGDGLNGTNRTGERSTQGRWPANVIHDGSEDVVAGFPETTSGGENKANKKPKASESQVIATIDTGDIWDCDTGSAARFFYCAKADGDTRIGSKHPTVKPLDLMQYLVRLVTPKGGTVLDMFAGSGTTGEAAFREGMKAVLIEREAEYQADIRRRVELCMAGPDERSREMVKARGLTEAPGPLFEWEAMWAKPFDREDLL